MDEQAGSLSGATPRPDEPASEVVLERGPGVHVVADPHPARAGRALAAALGADLADTAAAAERAISERLGRPEGAPAPTDVIDLREGAGETGALTGASDSSVGRLLAERLASYDAGRPMRTLAIAHVARLRLLATALNRAERVRARTERAASDRLSAPVEAGDAASPATEAPPVPPAEPGMTLEQIPSAILTEPTPERAMRSPDSALIAGGVLLLSVAMAGAILLTALPPILAIAPILLGLFIAGLIRRASAVPSERVRANVAIEASATTRGAGVSIDAPTAREARQSRGSRERVRDVDPGGTVLATAADPLEDSPRMRTAVAEDVPDPLAGGELSGQVGPSAVAVHDLASETAAVRAATQFVAGARQAWIAAWEDFGEEAPMDIASGQALDAALMHLQQRIEEGNEAAAVGDRGRAGARNNNAGQASRRRRLNEMLAGRNLEAVLEAGPGPLVFARSPLVLVEPFAGLDSHRRATMQRRLEMLAGHHEVIVIVHSGADRAIDIGP